MIHIYMKCNVPQNTEVCLEFTWVYAVADPEGRGYWGCNRPNHFTNYMHIYIHDSSRPSLIWMGL